MTCGIRTGAGERLQCKSFSVTRYGEIWHFGIFKSLATFRGDFYYMVKFKTYFGKNVLLGKFSLL